MFTCVICGKDLKYHDILRMFDNSFCSEYCKERVSNKYKLYAKELIKQNNYFLVVENCVVDLLVFKNN
jgi:predicted nucleic acid-binding Zn ribbon protein